MIIKEPVIQVVKEEKPKELNYKNVVYWSEHYKRLVGMEGVKEKTAHAIQVKAKLFLKNKSIQYDPNESGYDSYSSNFDGHRFICLPIKGYNSTTYRLWIKKDGSGECSCQFNQTNSIDCSHLIALFMWLKILNWNKKRN